VPPEIPAKTLLDKPAVAPKQLENGLFQPAAGRLLRPLVSTAALHVLVSKIFRRIEKDCSILTCAKTGTVLWNSIMFSRFARRRGCHPITSGIPGG
jgi:hypothetical protein